MKRLIITLFIVFTALISCKKEIKEEKMVIVPENLESKDSVLTAKSFSFTIDGMTCEVGCAGTIQKKLESTEGILSAQVNFEAKQAMVSYDSTKLSIENIVQEVEDLAGGGVYKVSNVGTGELAKLCCGSKKCCEKSCAKDASCKKDKKCCESKCEKGKSEKCSDSKEKCCKKKDSLK